MSSDTDPTHDRTPLEDARALVERLTETFGRYQYGGDHTKRIAMTDEVKTQMAAEISVLIDDTLRRREYQAS